MLVFQDERILIRCFCQMNAIVIASLSLVILAQAVNASNRYQYTRQCKANTEPCINLKCSATQQFPTSVPISLHYSCCKGIVIDTTKYTCVRYNYNKIVVQKCGNCTQFTCGDGQCTLKQWKCNNVKDCLDGTDEVGCGPCSSDQFYCRRAHQCIRANRVCDKFNDCWDGSDEVNCQNERGGSCAAGSYRCKNNKCIPWNRACDGHNDCEDGSDEAGYCKSSYYPKRDEISSFSENLFKKDGGVGGNGVEAAKGTVVN